MHQESLSLGVIALFCLILTACGGGGSSGSSNSSYSGTYTDIMGISYQCSNANVYNACAAGVCGGCTCTNNCPSTNTVPNCLTSADGIGVIVPNNTSCTSNGDTFRCSNGSLIYRTLTVLNGVMYISGVTVRCSAQ